MDDSSKPLVVLDATEIHRDWYLAGLEFQLMRFLISERVLSAIVPESVVIEAVANHEREYDRAAKLVLKHLRELRRVGGRDGVPADDQFGPVPEYGRMLNEKLENLGVSVAPAPSTTHSEIVERAARRLPPFDVTGSGYRDTLTWLTCRHAAAAGHSVFLVSRDKDFAGTDGQLAPSLAEEVVHLAGTVTLLKSLGPWLMNYIPWSRDTVASLPDAAALARDEEIASVFAPWDMFEDPGFTEQELGLPPSASIEEVGYAGSGGMWIDRKSHKRVGEGRFEVVYEFPIDFEVEFTINADEAFKAGYIEEDGPPWRRELVTQTIEMMGEMAVVHDEQDLQSGLTWYYEWFNFQPVKPPEEWLSGARSPQEPPGTPTLFDDPAPLTGSDPD